MYMMLQKWINPCPGLIEFEWCMKLKINNKCKKCTTNAKNIQQIQKIYNKCKKYTANTKAYTSISLLMQVPAWHCRPTAPNHCSDKSIDQTRAMNCSAKEKLIIWILFFGHQCSPACQYHQQKWHCNFL